MVFKKHWDVQDKLREIHEALGGDGRLDFYEIAYKKKCGVCGDEYYARREHARYCSQKCRNERNAEWRREQRAREKAERLTARQATCRQCGKAYVAKRRSWTSWRGEKIVGFCSDDCRKQEAESKRRKPCKTCGRKFKAKRNDAQFCSSACRQRAYRTK